MIVGTILGLTQFRIKRLFAYSTISHLGFILLALTINSLESIQAFIFYLMQYSVSNLNAFIILIGIGYSLYPYVDNSANIEENKKLLDRNYSPIQLINQIKGYLDINPYLTLCLAVTFFSFVGIPPLIGFFAKQMVLSAALDSGYVFITIIAVLTSVISAVYYLGVVKQIFFDKADYKINPAFENVKFTGFTKKGKDHELLVEKVTFTLPNIVLSNYLTITTSSLSLLLLLFVFTPQETLSMANILSLTLFNC